jgi:uncharacterized coiled-coil protein SlyX
MPVPWAQIVRLMPTILDVSRELMRRTRRAPPELPEGANAVVPAGATLEPRVAALEENERRQAELVTSMADQLAQLTTAVTVLHVQTRRLQVGLGAAAIVAIVALVFALR